VPVTAPVDGRGSGLPLGRGVELVLGWDVGPVLGPVLGGPALGPVLGPVLGTVLG